MPEVAPSLKPEVSTTLPWKVVVHNDPINLVNYVCRTFQKLFGHSREKAMHHTMEVHELGRSIVWTGEREKAEHFVQMLHQSLLLATLETSD